jgi:hypothetical protein
MGRVKKSMEALGKKTNVGKCFLAGEHWSGGSETKKLALELGCGILYENGSVMSSTNLASLWFPGGNGSSI